MKNFFSEHIKNMGELECFAFLKTIKNSAFIELYKKVYADVYNLHKRALFFFSFTSHYYTYQNQKEKYDEALNVCKERIIQERRQHLEDLESLGKK